MAEMSQGSIVKIPTDPNKRLELLSEMFAKRENAIKEKEELEKRIRFYNNIINFIVASG